MPNENNPNTGRMDGIENQLPGRDTLKSDAGDLIEKAKEAGIERTKHGKETVASQAEKLATVRRKN